MLELLLLVEIQMFYFHVFIYFYHDCFYKLFYSNGCTQIFCLRDNKVLLYCIVSYRIVSYCVIPCHAGVA